MFWVSIRSRLAPNYTPLKYCHPFKSKHQTKVEMPLFGTFAYFNFMHIFYAVLCPQQHFTLFHHMYFSIFVVMPTQVGFDGYGDLMV